MLRIGASTLRGEACAPPSKSATHRALLIAALADGEGTIRGPLLAADTRATLAAVAALGAELELEDARIRVRPARAPGASEGPIFIDCGNSGTTLRLVAGIAAARPGLTRLDGDASLRRRPMAPLLRALERAGVRIEARDGRAPLALAGPLARRDLTLEDASSSQFVSSLLLALTAAGGGSVRVRGPVASGPYLEMTIAQLQAAGVPIARTAVAPDGGLELRVPAGARPRAGTATIPGDWSSAAFPLCAAALAGDVTLRGLPSPASQADGRILGLLEQMGAELCRLGAPDEAAYQVRAAPLTGLEANLHDAPDLFPVLAVTLAHARGASRLHGAPQLRAKESDRVAVVAAGLRSQGIECAELPDGLEIAGGGRLAGGVVETAGDHRVLMAFASAACVAAAPIYFSDPDPAAVAAVSYPGFFETLQSLGLAVSER